MASGISYLVFSSSHPLAEKADKGEISVADFKNDTFYILPEEEIPFLWKKAKAFFKSKGFIPHFNQLPDSNSIISKLLMGSSYTFMYELTFAKDYQKLKYIPLDTFLTTGFIWKSDNTSMALKLFLETCVLENSA